MRPQLSVFLLSFLLGVDALRPLPYNLRQTRLEAAKQKQNSSGLKTAGILIGTIGLALGGNFLGITSSLLSTKGTEGSGSVLSQLYSIKGLRKVVSENYAFLIPSDWVPDYAVVQSKQRLREMPAELALRSPLQNLPESAFVGTASPIDNFSVIKSVVEPGFEMRKTLGSPLNALEFLSTSLAPTGSGKSLAIVDASESFDSQGNLRYIFEYIISKSSWSAGPRHTISVVTFEYPQALYTATLVIPEKEWPEVAQQGRKIAESFSLSHPPSKLLP